MQCRVNDLTVQYDVRGEGKVALFLHGWGSDLNTFNDVVSLLEPKFKVVLLDLPGFGETTQPHEDWHIIDYARFVKQFLREINEPETYAIIAHSFGGRVTIKAIHEGLLHPQKIVLIGSAGIRHNQTAKSFAYRTVAKTGKAVLRLPVASRYASSAKEKLYASANSSDYLESDGMKGIFLNAINEDLSGLLASIDTPSLLIWGSEDNETPLSDARMFHKQISGSILKIVQGASHFVHTEYPKKVGRWIEQFLS